MVFLAIEKELQPIPSLNKTALLAAEAEKALQLYEQGIIRNIYFNDRHEAVLMIEHNSEREVHNTLSSLPLVKEGFITFEITQLHPYTGFSRLKK